MKIALINVLPEEKWISINHYAKHLEIALKSLDSEFEIIPILGKSWIWPDYKFINPFKRASSLYSIGIYISRWLRYPRAINNIPADIYHILDNSYGHLVSFLKPRKTIVTFHQPTPNIMRQWIPNGPARWIYELSFKSTLYSNHVIAVSNFLKQDLIKNTNLKSNNISTIYHGIDPIFNFIEPRHSSPFRSKLLSRDEFLILNVGHCAPRKNVESLLYLVKSLRDNNVKARLIRIGNGPSNSQAKMINDLQIADFVTHLGIIPNDQLPDYYRSADMFVFPSFCESFGIPLIEAMACGTPIVCSDLEVFREICGLAATYINPYDYHTISHAILNLIDNSIKKLELRQIGLDRAKSFTWENAAKQTLAVYRAVIN